MEPLQTNYGQSGVAASRERIDARLTRDSQDALPDNLQEAPPHPPCFVSLF